MSKTMNWIMEKEERGELIYDDDLGYVTPEKLDEHYEKMRKGIINDRTTKISQ